MVPEQNRVLHRRPARNAAERARWFIPSSLSLAWCRMYVPVRTVTEPVRLSRTSARTATEPVIRQARRRLLLRFRQVSTTDRASVSEERESRAPTAVRRGDLLVEVIVSRHPIFQRQDMDIFSTVPISFPVAALGGTIRIKTVDGEVEYDVKPGTQTDTSSPPSWKRYAFSPK